MRDPELNPIIPVQDDGLDKERFPLKEINSSSMKIYKKQSKI